MNTLTAFGLFAVAAIMLCYAMDTGTPQASHTPADSDRSTIFCKVSGRSMWS